MPKITLDSSVVNRSFCPTGQRRLDLYDTAITGFTLEVRPSGIKTYYLRYRDKYGKQKQFRIGDTTSLSFARAKTVAQQLKTRVVVGEDPVQEKASIKHTLQLDSFVHHHFLPYIKQYKRGWKTNLSTLKNHILPEFGGLFLDQITQEAIIAFHCTMRDKGYAAVTCNNAVIMLRYMFNLAKKWDIKGTQHNPAAGIALFEVNNQRERFLTRSEVQALKDAIDESENVQLKHIVVLLLFTGCRKRELLDAKWEHFDMTRRIWRIPTGKSGKVRHVPLSDIVIEILEKVPRFEGCSYVLPNPQTQKPINTIYCSWNTAKYGYRYSNCFCNNTRWRIWIS
ncbi:MAG TPA: integrase [Methylococcaceae bacterium]|nr:integrase [Methylococcaceae bacterium]